MAQNRNEEASPSDNHEDSLNQQQSFIERRAITGPKMIKTVSLILLIAILIAILSFIVNDFILNAKKIFKITGSNSIEELSALDQEGYRSYYYFKQMKQIAKQNVKNNQKYNVKSDNRLKDITFKQLFGAFKVIKAIEQAKDFSSIPRQKDERGEIDEVQPQILQKAYNYTQYFIPAANQYQCASCYSFPITATIQYLYRRHFNLTIKLSEQQLIDCASADQTINGCSDGNITKGFQYARDVGLVQQENYPYRSKTGHSFPCRKDIVDDFTIPKFKISSFKILLHGNCQAIQLELSKGNAVASMIAIDPHQLNKYSQSTQTAFRNCPKQGLNHAITIVGQTQKQEWIVRNSWGSSWGKNGYFIMRGGNTCGVCTYAIVPELSNDIKNPLEP